MGVGRRHETPGSETQASSAVVVARVLAFVLDPTAPVPAARHTELAR